MEFFPTLVLQAAEVQPLVKELHRAGHVVRPFCFFRPSLHRLCDGAPEMPLLLSMSGGRDPSEPLFDVGSNIHCDSLLRHQEAILAWIYQSALLSKWFLTRGGTRP